MNASKSAHAQLINILSVPGNEYACACVVSHLQINIIEPVTKQPASVTTCAVLSVCERLVCLVADRLLIACGLE